MTGAAPALHGRPRLLDEAALVRAIARLAHELAERHPGEALVLAGIRTRGVPLAARLARALTALGQPAPGLVSIDPLWHRDDRPRPQRTAAAEPPAVTAPEGSAPPGIDARVVVLVDDVLHTGRTVRAAIDALLDQGRPAAIEVLVLIDRGHRELPLRATYVGKNVPTSPAERIAVRLQEVDGVDGAWMVGQP